MVVIGVEAVSVVGVLNQVVEGVVSGGRDDEVVADECERVGRVATGATEI